MATKANHTLHKEIHPEQEKRVMAEERIQNAKEGKLPPNNELEKGISKARTGINRDNDQLSTTGKNVTKDINNILDTTQSIISEKNQGEELQKAYYHAHKGGQNKQLTHRLAELRQMAMEDSSATREEAKKNVSSLATIVKLAILSPEFRETINDMAKIANQLLKNQGDRQGLGTTTGTSGMRTMEQTTTTPAFVSSVEQVQTKPAVVSNMEQTILPDGSVATSRVVEPTMVTEVQPVAKVVQPVGTTTSTLSGSGRRNEKEEKLIERLVDLAQTLHKHPEYKNSIKYLQGSASKLKKYTAEKNERLEEQKAHDKLKENTTKKEYHKHEARTNGKRFLEQWIGDDYSLDRLMHQIIFLQEKSKTDPELKSLLSDWKKWSTSTIEDSNYVSNREHVRRDVQDLIQRTRMMNSRYSEEVYIIRSEMNYINKSIQRDDSLLQLRNDVSKLGRDVFMDANGNPTIKPELMNDAQIMISSILDSIHYIPLPPIKGNKEDMDFELENIVLNATDVTPSNVKFVAKADTDRDSKTGSRQPNNAFLIKISKIRAHLTSVNFYINKKSGFPKICDRGLADIDLSRDGLSMVIEISPNVETRGKNDFDSVFRVNNVTCTIDKLKIHLRETSHDALYKILSPIINMMAKKRIETGISDYVKENLIKMNKLTAQRASTAATKTDKRIKEQEHRNS